MAFSNISLAIVFIIGISLAHDTGATLFPLAQRLAYIIPHNIARAKQLMPPVRWNDTLAEYAKSYAQERASDSALMHSTYRNPGYGENIAMSTGALTPAEAIRLWVGEKPFYNYGSNSCAEGQMCGHYTQVIWRDTKSIGCAKSRCQNGGTFITCNYYPPGNYIGESPY